MQNYQENFYISPKYTPSARERNPHQIPRVRNKTDQTLPYFNHNTSPISNNPSRSQEFINNPGARNKKDQKLLYFTKKHPDRKNPSRRSQEFEILIIKRKLLYFTKKHPQHQTTPREASKSSLFLLSLSRLACRLASNNFLSCACFLVFCFQI